MRTIKGLFMNVFQFFLFDDSGETLPLATWTRSRQRKGMESVPSLELHDLLSQYPKSSFRSFVLAYVYGFCEIFGLALANPGLTNDIKRSGMLVAVHHMQFDVLKLLAGGIGQLKITEAMMKEIVEYSTLEALDWLLQWCPDIKITRNVILAANRTSAEVMTPLLDHAKDLDITEDLLEAAAWAGDAGAMKVLLSRAGLAPVTTKAVSATARWGDGSVVHLLLDAGGIGVSRPRYLDRPHTQERRSCCKYCLIEAALSKSKKRR